LGTGTEYKLFEARWDRPVNCVAYSPDGRQILGAGGKVRTWDVQTGEPLVRFRGSGRVESAAFSQDGSEIAACALSDTSRTGLRVRRWQAATGKPLTCFDDPVHNRVLVSLAVVVPGSLRIVSTGKKTERPGSAGLGMSQTTAAVLSVVGTLAINAVLMPGGGYGYIIFEPSAPVFDPSDPYCMQIWGIHSGLAESQRNAGSARATALVVSADGKRALSANRDNIICLWGLPP
jgi:WD40 repeat protein